MKKSLVQLAFSPLLQGTSKSPKPGFRVPVSPLIIAMQHENASIQFFSSQNLIPYSKILNILFCDNSNPAMNRNASMRGSQRNGKTPVGRTQSNAESIPEEPANQSTFATLFGIMSATSG